MAFFDPNVSIDMKRKMIGRLKCKVPAVTFVVYRKFLSPDQLLNCDLSQFVSRNTFTLFTTFELAYGFIDLDPSLWEDNEEYQTAFDFFRNLFVVNDAAERVVKFMKDYNRVLTRDEAEMQLILQVVDSYRKKYPSHTKSALTDRSQTL